MQLAVYFLIISYVVADYFKIHISKRKPLMKFFYCFSFSILSISCSFIVKNN